MTIALSRRAFMGTAATLATANLAPAFAKDSPASLDAVGQAAAIKAKQVSPLELVDATIARIQAVKPEG